MIKRSPKLTLNDHIIKLYCGRLNKYYESPPHARDNEDGELVYEDFKDYLHNLTYPKSTKLVQKLLGIVEDDKLNEVKLTSEDILGWCDETRLPISKLPNEILSVISKFNITSLTDLIKNSKFKDNISNYMGRREFGEFSNTKSCDYLKSHELERYVKELIELYNSKSKKSNIKQYTNMSSKQNLKTRNQSLIGAAGTLGALYGDHIDRKLARQISGTGQDERDFVTRNARSIATPTGAFIGRQVGHAFKLPNLGEFAGTAAGLYTGNKIQEKGLKDSYGDSRKYGTKLDPRVQKRYLDRVSPVDFSEDDVKSALKKHSNLNDLYHQVRLQAGFKDSIKNFVTDYRTLGTAAGAVGGGLAGSIADERRDPSKKKDFWSKHKGKVIGAAIGGGLGYGTGKQLHTAKGQLATAKQDIVKEYGKGTYDELMNTYDTGAKTISAAPVAVGALAYGGHKLIGNKNKKDKEMGKVKLQSLINDPSVVDIQRVRLQSGETGYAVTRMQFLDKIGGKVASGLQTVALKGMDSKKGFINKAAGHLGKATDWMSKNKKATGAIATGLGAAAIGGTTLALRNRQLKKQRNRAQQGQ